MSIFFEILVRIASYGSKIDQSHGENRLSHIIIIIYQYFHTICPFNRADISGGPGKLNHLI